MRRHKSAQLSRRSAPLTLPDPQCSAQRNHEDCFFSCTNGCVYGVFPMWHWQSNIDFKALVRQCHLSGINGQRSPKVAQLRHFRPEPGGMLVYPTRALQKQPGCTRSTCTKNAGQMLPVSLSGVVSAGPTGSQRVHALIKKSCKEELSEPFMSRPHIKIGILPKNKIK